MSGLPDLELPDHLRDLANASYGSRSDFNRRVFLLGLWFCGQGHNEHDAVDWVVANVEYGKPKGHEPLVRHSVSRAYEKYDPALAGGSAAPDFAEDMTALYDRVEASNVKDKVYLLGLIQHAINKGRNPVDTSGRQLSALCGISLKSTCNAMLRLQASLGSGVLAEVTYDGIRDHSRSWRLDPSWTPDRVTHIQACICVTPEDRFVEWIGPTPVGTQITVAMVASKLAITRPAARKLLDKYTDEYFGGGFCAADWKTKQPAKWWREPPKPFFTSRQEAQVDSDPFPTVDWPERQAGPGPGLSLSDEPDWSSLQ